MVPAQYCLPTDAPHLARHARPLAMAMSPLLWTRHKPDLFDSYSAGARSAYLGVCLNRQGAAGGVQVCRCHARQGMHDSGLHAHVAAVQQRDAVATVCAGDMGMPERVCS